MFTVTQNERHPTDMAMLQGARLVTAQESEEGKFWAEAKIKALTGGDPITARFMRQDFFTYEPQFKLVIAGNHKPRLRNVDEAIRRRIHMVPFTVTIPQDERDKGLPAKLVAEYGGILQWAIEGCLNWQGIGLAPPRRVREETGTYLDTQDPLSGWIEDCCIVEGAPWASVADLYASYSHHTEQAREHVDTKRRFSERLEGLGYERERRGKNQDRGFHGITLKRPIH